MSISTSMTKPIVLIIILSHNRVQAGFLLQFPDLVSYMHMASLVVLYTELSKQKCDEMPSFTLRLCGDDKSGIINLHLPGWDLEVSPR